MERAPVAETQLRVRFVAVLFLFAALRDEWGFLFPTTEALDLVMESLPPALPDLNTAGRAELAILPGFGPGFDLSGVVAWILWNIVHICHFVFGHMVYSARPSPALLEKIVGKKRGGKEQGGQQYCNICFMHQIHFRQIFTPHSGIEIYVQ